MNMTTEPARRSSTRDVLLITAERLFAERGIHTASNRQVSEAAGQGNIAAVSYHFGTKAELIRAIARKHADEVERLRASMVIETVGSADIRDWVACLVRPYTQHLSELGQPTWYARFCAQVTGDPDLHGIMIEEAMASASLRMVLVGLHQCLPDLPPTVRDERYAMARHVTTQMSAERERALADGTPTLQSTWDDLANSLVDAIVGMWMAPVTHDPEPDHS